MDGNTVKFTTFRIATGELLQLMEASDIAVIDAQCDDDTSYVFGHWDPALYRVVAGEVVEKTAA